MKNNFDALIEEINLVQTQKEQESIMKAFETNKPVPSVIKSINSLKLMTKSFQQQHKQKLQHYQIRQKIQNQHILINKNGTKNGTI